MAIIDLLKAKIYIVTYTISVLVVGSYVWAVLFSLWLGSYGILLPVKIALTSGFAVAVGYPLWDFITSARKRETGRLVFSGIALLVTSSMMLAFYNALSVFLLTSINEPLINLTYMSFELKILITSGLVVIAVFFGLSFLHFMMSRAFMWFFEALGKWLSDLMKKR